MHVDWQILKRYVTLKIFNQGKDIKSILIFVNEKGNGKGATASFTAENAIERCKHFARHGQPNSLERPEAPAQAGDKNPQPLRRFLVNSKRETAARNSLNRKSQRWPFAESPSINPRTVPSTAGSSCPYHLSNPVQPVKTGANG